MKLVAVDVGEAVVIQGQVFVVISMTDELNAPPRAELKHISQMAQKVEVAHMKRKTDGVPICQDPDGPIDFVIIKEENTVMACSDCQALVAMWMEIERF